MATGKTYEKYGSSLPTFNQKMMSQSSPGEGFRQVLDDIGGLLKQAEQGYIEENTLNMQEYLRGQIKAAGLGKDPVDKIAIKKRFGNQINMAQLDETIEGTKQELLTDALDEASGAAGTAFRDTENIAEAGDAFKKRLMAAGLGERDATKHSTAWRDDNKFLAEDLKLHEANLVEDATNNVLQAVKSGVAYEMAEEESIAALPAKLQSQAKLQTREMYKKLATLTEDQLDEYNYYDSQSKSYVDAQSQQWQQKIANAKANYDAVSQVSPEATAAITSLNAKLGGLPGSIEEATDNNWFKDAGNALVSFFSGDRDTVTDEAAARYATEKIQYLVQEENINPDDAAAIVFQAYNDTAAITRDNFHFGEGADVTEMDRAILYYIDQNDKKKAALADYQQVQQEAISAQDRMNRKRQEFMYQLRSGERQSNVNGNPFDSAAAFKKSIYSATGGSFVGEADKPAKEETKPAKNETKPTVTNDPPKSTDTLEERAEKLRQRGVESKAKQDAAANQDNAKFELVTEEERAAYEAPSTMRHVEEVLSAPPAMQEGMIKGIVRKYGQYGKAREKAIRKRIKEMNEQNQVRVADPALQAKINILQAAGLHDQVALLLQSQGQ